jgi:hypothetical protein
MIKPGPPPKFHGIRDNVLAQVASTQPTPLRVAANAYDKALGQLADQAGVAA